MIIKSIDLAYYRNYNKFHIDLHPSMNIIIGPNGIGKTNILESLVVISNTKSFRTNDDFELVNKQHEYAKIVVNTTKNQFKIIINNKGKVLYIDQNLIYKSSEFIGKLNVILFKPNDIELFDASPKHRRKLLDIEIGKLSKTYLNSLLVYSKLLKDRNNLLKNDKIDYTYLEVINKRMIEHIINIINYRQDMLGYINQKINDYYFKLSNTKIDIRIEYDKCCNADTQSVIEMFEKANDKDLLYHYSTCGIQKDDYHFYFDGNLISSFASQGQKRMVMIAFKLSLVEYIKKCTNTTAVLLLDDILSELDQDNKNRLLDMIPADIQTVITTTDLDGIRNKPNYKIFKLRKEMLNE